jgi:hypothetical protein
MPDIVFDLNRVAALSRSASPTESSNLASATLKTNAIPSDPYEHWVAAGTENVFLMHHNGPSEGAGQRYIYFEIVNSSPIRLTRIRFRSNTNVSAGRFRGEDPATLAIERSDNSNFAGAKLLGNVRTTWGGPALKDLPVSEDLKPGTHYIRIRATTAIPDSRSFIAYCDLRLSVELMPDIVFDLSGVAVGSTSVAPTQSSDLANVTLKTNDNIPSGQWEHHVASLRDWGNVFLMHDVGPGEGARQRYVYFEIVNPSVIRLTRIRFRSNTNSGEEATLAIERSDSSDFASVRTLGTVQTIGGAPAEKDLTVDEHLMSGTHYIRIRVTAMRDSRSFIACCDLRLSVEPDAVVMRPGGIHSTEYVAQLLAPNIRFHPSERHFPCSVEWFMQRCRLVAGHGELKPETTWGLDVATHFRLPDGMSVLREGPLDPALLPNSALQPPAKNASDDDNISLYPMEAAPGQEAAWNNEISTRVYFSDYQLKTLYGQPLVDGKCAAPCYFRITHHEGNYRISYMFFCGYNGSMGPDPVWDGVPLAAGFYAHIGDWMRVTAVVSIDRELTTLHAVEYERHGDTIKITDGDCSFSNKTYEQITRIPVYAAWHSHETYEKPGDVPVPGIQGLVARDYTGNGAEWPTWRYLEPIDEKTPWIHYKGLWGANIKVLNSYLDRIPGADSVLLTMKNGPNGPAYKDGWWIGTPHRSPPFAPPGGGPNSRDVLDVKDETIAFGTLQTFPTRRDIVVTNKLSEPVSIMVQLTSALAADRSRRVGEPLYPPVLSIYLQPRFRTVLGPNQRVTLPLAANLPLVRGGSSFRVYSPSDFKGFVGISVVDKHGWIVLPVTGAIDGGEVKPGVGGHVRIRDSDVPPLDLSETATQ